MKKLLSVLLALSMIASCALLVSCGSKDPSKPEDTPGTNPAETKSAETKPAETKPAETKPAETKPAETKSEDTKSGETQPVEIDNPCVNDMIDQSSIVSENPFYTNANGTEERAANLFDDSEETKWCLNFDPFNLPTVQFATTAPISITSYEFWSANDTDRFPGRNPAHFVLYGSSDNGATWNVVIDDDLDMEPEAFLPCDTVYLGKPSDPYALFKLEITEIVEGTILQISQFNIYGAEA